MLFVNGYFYMFISVLTSRNKYYLYKNFHQPHIHCSWLVLHLSYLFLNVFCYATLFDYSCWVTSKKGFTWFLLKILWYGKVSLELCLELCKVHNVYSFFIDFIFSSCFSPSLIKFLVICPISFKVTFSFRHFFQSATNQFKKIEI